jgi:hypothetical protein
MDGSRSRENNATSGLPTGVRILLCALFIGLAAHAAHSVLGLGGSGVDSFFNDWVYNAVMTGAAVTCLCRGLLIRTERVAWLTIGAGMACWSAGELYWTLHLARLETVPYPSLEDAFYLCLYPALYVGVVLLVRARVTRFHASLWLDGAIGALGIAAVGSALLYPAIEGSTNAAPATVAVNLAYPLCDVLLLSFVVGALALTGWRPGRAWMLIAGGLLANACADGVFLYLEEDERLQRGTGLDSLWIFGSVLVALAAWDPRRKAKPLNLQGLRLMAVPSVFGLIALTILALGTFGSINHLALGLATATLFVVLARMVLSFRENCGWPPAPTGPTEPRATSWRTCRMSCARR